MTPTLKRTLTLTFTGDHSQGVIQVLRDTFLWKFDHRWTVHLRNAEIAWTEYTPPPSMVALRNTWMTPNNFEQPRLTLSPLHYESKQPVLSSQ